MYISLPFLLPFFLIIVFLLVHCTFYTFILFLKHSFSPSLSPSLPLSLPPSLSPPLPLSAPYLSLSLDPSPELSLTLGEEYTLMCAALLPDTLNPSIVSITWYKDSSPFTGSGITTSLTEGTSNLNLGMVLSQEAGNYTCVANVSSPYIDTGYNLIVSNTTLITVSSKCS